MAAPLQYDQAACLARLQATSTRGVPARLRRVAGCATPTGSAGHAGAMANLKLTFQPDHSAGADHLFVEKLAAVLAQQGDDPVAMAEIVPEFPGVEEVELLLLVAKQLTQPP